MLKTKNTKQKRLAFLKYVEICLQKKTKVVYVSSKANNTSYIWAYVILDFGIRSSRIVHIFNI